MAELFSDEWMKGFMEEWNKESELVEALAKIDFSSTICYGFKGEDDPRGFLKVEKGKCIDAGSWSSGEMNWDLRADAENWKKWFEKGIGMGGLGMAYTTGKLKFKVGDYKAMIKDPRMAAPFIKSFSVMGKVGT